MNIEEIRKNAPEGATHIDVHGDYWKVKGDIGHFYMDEKWFRYCFNDVQKHIKIGDIKPL